MSKQCAIFFYEGYVGVAPTIINLSKVMQRQGYVVTIYATENDYAQPGKIGENVKIIYFCKDFKSVRFLNRTRLKPLVPLVKLSIFLFQVLTHQLRNQQLQSLKNNINIGVDIYGNVTAMLCLYFLRQKFLFLSLELWKPVGILSKMANLAYRKAVGVITQSEGRVENLSSYYEYQHPQPFYLPNSSFATEDETLAKNVGNFFREKFNLNRQEFPYLIVQAGMINDAVLAKTIAEVFNHIDDGYALIFHERKERKEEEPYIQSLRKLNSKNLFLSLQPVPYEEVDRVYAAATIGLAFYANLGNDYALISMASGKLAEYLKHGKPVLVSNLPSLCKLVDEYQFGIVINNPSDSEEIKTAIQQILSDFDTYSKNAKACFATEFDFGKKMEPILLFMEDL